MTKKTKELNKAIQEARKAEDKFIDDLYKGLKERRFDFGVMTDEHGATVVTIKI